jgi:hypothetical protein
VARDTLFLFAADALEGSERDELARHLAEGCPRCAEGLARSRDALALLTHALDPVAPPPDAKERLLARIAASDARPEDPETRPSVPAHRPRRVALRRSVALAAGIGALAGAGLVALVLWRFAVSPLAARSAALERELEAARVTLAERGEAIEDQDAELGALEERARLADERARLLRAAGLEVMALSAARPEGTASGRVFWEPVDYGCYLHAEHLPAPGSGRTYVLWMVSTRGETIAAGSFAPDARGDAELLARLPKHFPPVARTLVTDEPVSYGDAPAGPVHLAGEATRVPTSRR